MVTNKMVSEFYLIALLLFCAAEIVLCAVLIFRVHRKMKSEKRAKEEVRKYQDMVDGALEGIFEAPLEGNPYAVNAALARMLGYDSPHEVTSSIIGAENGIWADADQRSGYAKLLKEAGAIHGYECQFKRKNGTSFWVSLSARCTPGLDRRTIICTTFVEDLTERREAERKASRLELRYRSLRQTLMDGFMLLSRNGLIKEHNERLSEMMGYTAEELLRLTNQDLTPDEWREVDLKVVEQILAQGHSDNYQKQYQRKDGTRIPVEARASLVSDGQRDNDEMLIIVRDTNEREHAAAALRESEERFRLVAESVDHFVWEVDASGLYRYASPSVEKILGFRSDELTGKMHFYDLFAPEVREEAKVERFEVFAARRSFRALPFPTVSKDGRAVHFESAGGPMLDQNGNLIGYVGMDTAITEPHELEARIRNAEKLEALGVFLSGISHDFNNILAAMIGFTELARDNLSERSRARHHLKLAIDAGVRGRDLVKEILAFSRPAEQQKMPVLLSDIVKQSTNFLRATIPTTINMRVNVESESFRVLGEPVKLQQVIMNLGANAAYAMRDRGGEFTIELSDFAVSESERKPDEMTPGLYMKLVIRDTGIGIAPEVMNRIFDPFFTTKTAGEGTGIGLSVVRDIIQQHNGLISVESELSQGTSFTIYLPAVAEVSRIEAADREKIVTGRGERVLFVDDEEALTKVAQRVLKGLGYKVTVTNSSLEALRLFVEEPQGFDLIVTDQIMPGMTGLELARVCEAIRPGIPIVLATGFSHVVDAAVAREAGIRVFAAKPLTKGELAQTIRQALDGQAA
jgi:PAS domain S-box-containing protein